MRRHNTENGKRQHENQPHWLAGDEANAAQDEVRHRQQCQAHAAERLVASQRYRQDHGPRQHTDEPAVKRSQGGDPVCTVSQKDDGDSGCARARRILSCGPPQRANRKPDERANALLVTQ